MMQQLGELATRVVRILMATGSLEWDLPATVQHPAGGILTVRFRLVNPTNTELRYRIYLALFDLQGALIPGTTGPIEMNGQDISVPAGSERTITLHLRIDYSNCYIQAALYDIENNTMGVGLQATLEQPPGLEEELAPAISGITAIAVIGMLLPLVVEMAEG